MSTDSEQHCARTETRLRLREWLFSAPGQCLLTAEMARMNRVLPNLFGYHLLQVGRLGDSDMLGSSRVLNRIILDVDGSGGGHGYSSFTGCADALPVASDSLDVVVVPHMLEFDANPHQALREVERVLVPEGHVVITGFNPWSLMGLWRWLGSRRRGAPWSGHFLSLTRVKDWLALLGFDILDVSTFYFRTPSGSERVIERLSMLDTLGERFWPYLGGAYLVVGRKRVVTLTPIKTRWQPERKLVTARWAEPTAMADYD